MKEQKAYLLDTDTCIFTIRERPPEVIQRVKKMCCDKIFISSVTVSELEYGIQKSKQKCASRDALIRFLVPFEIVDFTARDACEYGKIRAWLEARGKIIGPYDLQIAAQAMSRGLTLVTNNVREFSRIPGLLIENWVQRI